MSHYKTNMRDIEFNLFEVLNRDEILGTGPFETIDLNAPGGIRDYVERYQGIYERLHPSQQRRVDWNGPVLDEIERDRRKRLPADQLEKRQRWRDRRLMALAAQKKKAAREIGS